MNQQDNHTSQRSLDHESRVVAADHAALKLWLRLLTCTNLIEAALGQRLRKGFASTLPRFDLLAQLEREPDGLRMSELSRRLMVTGGNITGLADQLEAEGLLVREPVAHDRRAIRLRLTPGGRTRFGDMAREHEAWVADMLASLSPAEQQTLRSLLGKLKGGLADPANHRATLAEPPGTGAPITGPPATTPLGGTFTRRRVR